MCDSNIPMILQGVGRGGRLHLQLWRTSLPVTLAVRFPLNVHLCMHLPLFGLRKLPAVAKPHSLQSPSPAPHLPRLPSLSPLFSNGPLAIWGSSLPSASACLVGQLRAVPALEFFLFLPPRSKIWGCRPCPAVYVIPVFRCSPQDLWLLESRTGGGGVCSSG